MGKATTAQFSYAQSKLANLMFTQHLAVEAVARGWNLLSAMPPAQYYRRDV